VKQEIEMSNLSGIFYETFPADEALRRNITRKVMFSVVEAVNRATTEYVKLAAVEEMGGRTLWIMVSNADGVPRVIITEDAAGDFVVRFLGGVSWSTWMGTRKTVRNFVKRVLNTNKPKRGDDSKSVGYALFSFASTFAVPKSTTLSKTVADLITQLRGSMPLSNPIDEIREMLGLTPINIVTDAMQAIADPSFTVDPATEVAIKSTYAKIRAAWDTYHAQMLEYHEVFWSVPKWVARYDATLGWTVAKIRLVMRHTDLHKKPINNDFEYTVIHKPTYYRKLADMPEQWRAEIVDQLTFLQINRAEPDERVWSYRASILSRSYEDFGSISPDKDLIYPLLPVQNRVQPRLGAAFDTYWFTAQDLGGRVHMMFDGSIEMEPTP
jgi:hypothetical protein